ncbi:unnamed protein product, partial [Larinioides sclopetarius]
VKLSYVLKSNIRGRSKPVEVAFPKLSRIVHLNYAVSYPPALIKKEEDFYFGIAADLLRRLRF